MAKESGVEAEKGDCSVGAAVDDGSVYLVQYGLLEFWSVLVHGLGQSLGRRIPSKDWMGR